jgi:hypothetical protein
MLEVDYFDDEGNHELSLRAPPHAWWNTFIHIGQAVHPLLAQFRDSERFGYPASHINPELGNEEEYASWNAVVVKMTEAFRLIATYDEWHLAEGDTPERWKLIEDGLLEFAANFFNLWD